MEIPSGIWKEWKTEVDKALYAMFVWCTIGSSNIGLGSKLWLVQIMF